MDSYRIRAGFQESGSEETLGPGSQVSLSDAQARLLMPAQGCLTDGPARQTGASSRPWPVVLLPWVGPGWALAGVWGGEMEEGEATSSAPT